MASHEPAAPIAAGHGAVAGTPPFSFEHDPTRLLLPADATPMMHAHAFFVDPRDGSIVLSYQPLVRAANSSSLTCFARWRADGSGGVALHWDPRLCEGVPHGVHLARDDDGTTALYHANNGDVQGRGGVGVLHKTTLDGALLWSVRTPPTRKAVPMLPTMAASGPGSPYIYLADGYGTSLVHAYYKSNGSYSGVSFGGKPSRGTAGAAPSGRFWQAHGLNWDARRGQLVVTDRGCWSGKTCVRQGFHQHWYVTVEEEAGGARPRTRASAAPRPNVSIEFAFTVPELPRPCTLRVAPDGTHAVIPSLDGKVGIVDAANTLVSLLDVNAALGAAGHAHPHDAIMMPGSLDLLVATWSPGRLSYWRRVPSETSAQPQPQQQAEAPPQASATCAALPPPPRDFRRVAPCSSDPWYRDWAALEAITNDPTLHVLLVWPSAVAASSGDAGLRRARSVAADVCATHGGVVHERSVPLRARALATLVRTIYARPLAHDDAAACDDAPLPTRLHAFVVHSSPERMPACEAALHDALAGSPADAAAHRHRRGDAAATSGARRDDGGRGTSACDAVARSEPRASCNGTRHHAEAVRAAQILFHERSLSLLRHGTGEAACVRYATDLASDLRMLAARAPSPLSPAPSAAAQPATPPLLPADMAVDSGGVLELTGLRVNDLGKRHVAIVFDAHATAATQLVHACAPPKKGAKPGGGEGPCTAAYISHSPPSPYFRFHGASTAAELLHDPRSHAYCGGLKLIAPHALRAYKQRRHKEWHWAHDGNDAALLANWTAADAEACVAAGGVVSLPSGGESDLPRCV